MSLSAALAAFVTSLETDTISPSHLAKLRACLLNGYGVALAGGKTPYYRRAGAAVMAEGGGGPATLLYDGRCTTIGNAAFANAALFHGRTQEDTCGTVHLGAIAIPLLTAMLESGDYPMDRFLPALLAGYEVSGLFDLAYGSVTSAAGLRPSLLYGTLGAAAAAARMMDLDEDRTAAALSHAASFTGGLLQSLAEGTEEWRYQVGIAARTGFTAAALAKAGARGARLAFEGPAGFLAAYLRTDGHPEDLAATLGESWAIDRVAFKPYPVCAFNQTPIAIALALREQIIPHDIRAVRIRMNPVEAAYPGIATCGPFHSIAGALMSTPFCVATTLLYGIPEIGHLQNFADPDVIALAGRITVIKDAGLPNLSATIEVDAPAGTIIEGQRVTAADFAYNWSGVSALVRRIGGEQSVAKDVLDQLETFVGRVPVGAIRDVVALFAAATESSANPIFA